MCLAKKKKKKVRKVHFWQSAKNIKLTSDPFLALKRSFSIAADSQWGWCEFLAPYHRVFKDQVSNLLFSGWGAHPGCLWDSAYTSCHHQKEAQLVVFCKHAEITQAGSGIQLILSSEGSTVGGVLHTCWIGTGCIETWTLQRLGQQPSNNLISADFCQQGCSVGYAVDNTRSIRVGTSSREAISLKLTGVTDSPPHPPPPKKEQFSMVCQAKPCGAQHESTLPIRLTWSGRRTWRWGWHGYVSGTWCLWWCPLTNPWNPAACC